MGPRAHYSTRNDEEVELLTRIGALECVFDGESDGLSRLGSMLERVVDERQPAW